LRVADSALTAWRRLIWWRPAGADVGIDRVGRGIVPPHLARYLEIAGEVGSPILRVVVDTADHKPSDDEIVRTLREVAPSFERTDVINAIENHDRFKARALAAIIERIDSRNVGICLDTANSFGAMEGPEVVVPTLGPFVVNLHLKDFTIRRLSHNFGFEVEGCPAGQGMLNVGWLLDSLRAFGRDPNAILELWPPPEPEWEATLAKEAAWAEESVKYLRRSSQAEAIARRCFGRPMRVCSVARR
jgi:sugar phosphate isomerase/epimerase